MSSSVDPVPWEAPAKTSPPKAAKANRSEGETRQGAVRLPVLIRLADVKAEPVQWLWPNRIALGKLTLIAGDPGLGKSFITLDMAARISTGTPWPDSPLTENPAGGVVLLSAEDDLADTIRPRLDAAHADASRIVAIEAVKRQDPETGCEISRSFSLAADLPVLEEAIRQVPGCRLVVVDPITAYLDRTDSHVNAEVRALLAPLSELARRCGVALVAVTHLNKASTLPAVYRAMGSLAFVAAARAVWAVTKDKDDPEERRRLFLPIKNNLGIDRTGLAYRLEHADNGSAYVAWEPDPVSVSADDVLAGERGRDGEPGDRAQATEWLRDALADGPVRSTEVITQARANAISEKTLRRAFQDIGGKPRKTSFDGGWYWSLPGEDGQDDREDSQDALSKRVGIFGEVGHLGSDEHAEGIPEGWTPEGWAARLRQMADTCETTDPERAAELRKQAEDI